MYIDNRRIGGGLTGLSLSQIGISAIPNQTGFVTDAGGSITIPVSITLPASWINISVSLSSFFEFFLISGTTPDGLSPGDVFSLISTQWQSNLSANVLFFGNNTNNPDGAINAVVGYRFIGQAIKEAIEPTSDDVVSTPYSFIYKTAGQFLIQGVFTPNS